MSRQSNPYQPELAEIQKVTRETGDIKTFRVAFQGQALRENFTYRPGQFAEVSVFGVGEAPFCLTSTPSRPGSLEFSIKEMGMVTTALHGMEPGEVVGLRGPLGNGFPVEEWDGQQLLFIGGGIGLAPLRSAINYCFDNRDEFGKTVIIYGARTPADVVFKSELETWAQMPDSEVHLTVDEGDESWQGNVGLIPGFVKQIGPRPDGTIAITCGPPIMIKFALQALEELEFPADRIITSLEMKMKCGIGKCGRCNVGSAYVCQDGPVFSLARLKELGGRL